MGRWTVGLVALACVAFACGEAGTIVAEDGGASDAGEGHDITFVPQVDGDSGDGTMEEPVDGGDGGDSAAVMLGEPTFMPPSGTENPPSVTLVPPIPFPAGAFIFYTTDGSPPTDLSPVYEGPLPIAGTTPVLDAGCPMFSTTVSAMAGGPGYVDSPVATATYFFTPIMGGGIADVVFDPASETANDDILLSLSFLPAGTTICYTLDGTTPTCNAATPSCAAGSSTYSAPITLGGTETSAATGLVTVTATWCAGASPCGAPSVGTSVSQIYDLVAAAPTMTNPGPGTVSAGVTPTLATVTVSSTEPASIHMTTDGSTPTCTTGTALPGSSTVGPFTKTTTVNAIACKTGYVPSNAVTFAYTIP